jgi:hypothetical protein
MSSLFHPPGIESLADIETSDASYGEETQIIQGIILPSGQGGWPGKNDGYEVHCIAFAAWRRVGDAVVNRKLTLLRPVPPNCNYWGDFPMQSIQRFRVLLSLDETRAIIAESLPVDVPDEELEELSEELRKPVVIVTKRFGDLVLDRSIGLFEADTKWNGREVRIRFPLDEEEVSELALNTAEALWSEEAEWNMRIEECAVEELLDLRNDTWRQDGEPELTAVQFVARMALTDISITSEGEFEFWYDDGELFWDHAIMVSGDLQNGPTDAGIHG